MQIYKFMMNKEKSNGFFCVVYFSNTKKTTWYHKVYNPSQLANKLRNWAWIKIYINKQDYHSNPKGNNYYSIFDENNPITRFVWKNNLKSN